MSASIALTCVLIVLARVADVTLDTLRTSAIVQGRRGFSAMLGFFEALIFISVVAKVLLNLDHPIYALAYGLGYALGTYLGIVIEQHLAFGNQVASFFTRQGEALAKALAGAGYLVAGVQGHVRDGDVTILYVQVARKQVQQLIRDARKIDARCFCVVNDIRMAGYMAPGLTPVGNA